MSLETGLWLNTMTLQGFTAPDKRGLPWHFEALLQGEESNCYPLGIPGDDVLRRLFNFELLVAREPSVNAVVSDSNGEPHVLDTTMTGRAIVFASDTHEIMGNHGSGYQVHQYSEWLLKALEDMLGEGVEVASAGLLQGRRQAWVQFQLPDNRESAGMKFRPFVTCVTSCDGSLATTYVRGNQIVVCDNTMRMALGDEDAMKFRITHTKHSINRLEKAITALELIDFTGESFARRVAVLAERAVTDREWSRFIDLHFNKPADDVNAIAKGKFESRVSALTGIYNGSPMVAPWNGTALGVVQAVNTYNHWSRQVRTRSRTGQAAMTLAERNAVAMATGDVDDMATVATLNKAFRASRTPVLQLV
jgi:phage/plasmid-like protein (TIGR03299 family)